MNLIFNEKFGRREDNVSLSLFRCLEGPLGQDFCSLLPLCHRSFLYLLHKYLLSVYGVSGIVLGLGKDAEHGKPSPCLYAIYSLLGISPCCSMILMEDTLRTGQ